MRASLEVADILRAAGPAYRAAYAGHLSLHQLKVMSAIENCRTAALGGHVEACEDCGHQRIAYNSCVMGKFYNGESLIWAAVDALMTLGDLGRTDWPMLPIKMGFPDPYRDLAIEAIVPPNLRKGSFRPPDRLIAMLRGAP